VKEGDHYKYPRLETIMENCIKIIEGKEVVEEGQKGALGKPGKPGVAPPKKPPATAQPGKPGVKGGKPGAGGKGNEEEVKEKTALEKEMEESLELEKQGTAYRVMLIYTYALRVLTSMRKTSLDVYEKINVWIEYGFKVDCDLMDEVVSCLLNPGDSFGRIYRGREEDTRTTSADKL
jgi:hypothetical protein